MVINIVTVSSGWILQKIAERIAKNYQGEHELRVSHVQNPETVNYYVDFINCNGGFKTKCDIGYFSHVDRDNVGWLRSSFSPGGQQSNLDGIISMCARYTSMVVEAGYNKPLITLVPGETRNMFSLNKIKIGIVSRGGYPGYGQHFLESFFSRYNLPNFEFHFLGSGWENAAFHGHKTAAITLNSNEDYAQYPEFYKKIDYLLIPGLWTAGPMSLQEALACGIPIIGSDVGLVNSDFKVDYSFAPGNEEQLFQILQEIEKPRLERRKQIEGMSWANYANQTVEFIVKVANEMGVR